MQDERGGTMSLISVICRLSYKNLLECKKDIIIAFISMIFFNAVAVLGIAVLDMSEDVNRLIIQLEFVTGAVLTYLVTGEAQSAVIGCDRTAGFYSFISTVPYGIAKLTVSKYVLVLVISLIETLLFSLLSCVIGCGLNPAFPFLLMIIQFFMRAVEIPLMLLFGVKSGKAVKGSAFGAAIMAFIIYLLYGDISWYNADMITGIMNFAEGIMNNIGEQVMWLCIIGAGVTVIYAVSLFGAVTAAKRNFTGFETV